MGFEGPPREAAAGEQEVDVAEEAITEDTAEEEAITEDIPVGESKIPSSAEVAIRAVLAFFRPFPIKKRRRIIRMFFPQAAS